MFEKRFWRAILAFMMICAGFTVGNIGSTLAQTADQRIKFPPVDLLPAEIQKETSAAELAYKDLLFADAESTKAFEYLKQTMVRSDQSEIRMALGIYDTLHGYHFDLWMKVTDHLFKCSEMINRLVSFRGTNFFEVRRQRDQYSAWREFMSDGWKKALPSTEERSKVLEKAWIMIFPRPAIRSPLPRSPSVI